MRLKFAILMCLLALLSTSMVQANAVYAHNTVTPKTADELPEGGILIVPGEEPRVCMYVTQYVGIEIWTCHERAADKVKSAKKVSI